MGHVFGIDDAYPDRRKLSWFDKLVGITRRPDVQDIVGQYDVMRNQFNENKDSFNYIAQALKKERGKKIDIIFKENRISGNELYLDFEKKQNSEFVKHLERIKDSGLVGEIYSGESDVEFDLTWVDDDHRGYIHYYFDEPKVHSFAQKINEKWVLEVIPNT